MIVKIPSFTFRVELVILILLLAAFVYCFTFQSCFKVTMKEGFSTIVEELKKNNYK